MITAPVVALVLAAGRATRFGSAKLLALLDGSPLIQHCVDRVCASAVDDVIVVAGDRIEEIRHTISDTRARVMRNPHPEDGLASSLRAGVAAAPEAGALIIVLGDQPRIDPAVIDALISMWRRGEGRIVVPRYRGTQGHPVLFDGSLRAELLVLTGDRGAREVIATHEKEVAWFAVDADAPHDVDFPEDLVRVRERE